MRSYLLHYIPHEIGDFAILMKSCFDEERAVRYQLYTALAFKCIQYYVREQELATVRLRPTIKDIPEQYTQPFCPIHP